MNSCDVLVLGGGTAGTAAAKAVTEAGAEAVLVNDGELGGLCILRGCMPTKTMLHAAHAAHEAEHGRTPGVVTRLESVDFRAIMANKDAKVARFQAAKVRGIEDGGYRLARGRARFLDAGTVQVGDERFQFRAGCVIATGSTPRLPAIEGAADVPHLTSDEVMRLDRRPRSLLVVGSGAVGLELAQFFARVGTEVTLVSRRRVLEKIDPDVAREVEAFLRDEPRLDLRQPLRPLRFRSEEGGVAADLEDGSTVRAETLLLATGRAPDVAGLDLAAAGIETRDGRIASPTTLQTSNPRVFAAGDVTGERQLLHVANWEGRVAGLNALRGPELEVERRLDVEVVFSDPPAAWIGASEAEARARGEDVVTAAARLADTGRAITMDVRHGVFKLVARRVDGEILGAQLVGPRADDVVHVLATLMAYRGTAGDMLGLPWYHPTLSEVLLSLAREIGAAVDSSGPRAGAAGTGRPGGAGGGRSARRSGRSPSR